MLRSITTIGLLGPFRGINKLHQPFLTRGFQSSGPRTMRRNRPSLPMNTVIKFVPQQQAWIVERFGKFLKVLQPGLRILLPVVDEIKYVHSLKEIALEIPSQSAITQDNVTLHLDGVLYLVVDDPYKASYGVEDPEYAVKQLAQTTMRSELGKMKLDEVFKERSQLNLSIVDAINNAAAVWGIRCLRYEIRDIALPDKVVEAMQMQVAAERRKRAEILESEGKRESAINIAEGAKQSAILASEAIKLERINHAQGEAEAIRARAEATAEGLRAVASAAEEKCSEEAMVMRIAEDYVAAFSNLAKTTNTMLLPANTGDAGSMIAQAMGVINTVKSNKK